MLFPVPIIQTVPGRVPRAHLDSTLCQRHQPAGMILVRVRQEHAVQTGHALLLQHGLYHAPPLRLRGVNQIRASPGLHKDGVALADIDHQNLRLLAALPARRAAAQKQPRQHHQKRQTHTRPANANPSHISIPPDLAPSFHPPLYQEPRRPATSVPAKARFQHKSAHRR